VLERIIDFSEEPVRLNVRHANLVVRRVDESEICIPLSDIAVVVASHPAISFTHAVLSGLAASGASFVVCDDARLPVGQLLPLQGNFVQAERFAAQTNASAPTAKRLWQAIVQAKIESQASVLALHQGQDFGLRALVPRVRSGDPDNLEAQAARRYWSAVFGGAAFERNRAADGVNAVLNYGYTVLRAMTARAICAAGLHPSIGLHHHNRYSQFALADDLMEPFRSIIDRAALAAVAMWGMDVSVDKQSKALIFEHLTARYLLDGERRTLFDVLARLSTSLVAVFEGRGRGLALPTFPEFFECGEAP
jgi:CRISPR-associated protein Cas1